ncbi:ABC transporter substrate-binding protein [Antarcticirhabdus aurantiaca]|uniref:ABC transporter substrate-binding protein n=1 Tax=Antarcticirhabdus aurantiaca TaxID=2606717 RepID=UPI00131C3F3B|nr:ABC transporter substrate-binding protein [Antarcticirhabdus aurantiaca]
MSLGCDDEEDPLQIVVFPGGFNWPLFVADEGGFFADNRVAVNITPTPDSKFQMAGLVDGRFDIAFTAMDNVVAYLEGQGAVETRFEPDLVAFMGSDSGFLRLVSVPDIATIEQLAGRRLGVDALTTGYAFVLRKLLDMAGIKQTEIRFVQAGGVKSRYDSLLRRDFDATLLVTPFEAMATDEGCNQLADASRALGAYQGVVAATRRRWAHDNREKILAFIRSYRAALDWLFDPGNKTRALEIFRRNVPGAGDALAGKSYDILLDAEGGFFRDGRLDRQGIANVVALRSEYGRPVKLLNDSLKYYDTIYLEDALV